MGFINNIKNAKGNWKTIQSSPYASLKFRYETTKITIILFSLFIMWQIYSIIINYRGSGYMSWITKGFTLVIGILIVSKAWQTLAPMKRALKPYDKDNKHINHSPTDVKCEIDDILDKFDNNGDRYPDNFPNNNYKEEKI